MTKIEWTDQTWNPTTGCTRVSAGCDNCYAVPMTRRLAGMGHKKYQGLCGKGHFNGVVKCHEDALESPRHWRKPRMVFVNSMSDLFHRDVPFDFIACVYAVMASCSRHTFQILTKRPERAAEFCQWVTDQAPQAGRLYEERVRDHFDHYKMQFLEGYSLPGPPTPELRLIYDIAAKSESRPTSPDGTTLQYGYSGGEFHWLPWPLPNVWLGTSVEDQSSADERIPHLLKCPAALRFLSCEPLLGPIDLSDYGILSGCDFCCNGDRCPGPPECTRRYRPECPHCNGTAKCHVDWVIVGGESGPGARPCEMAWIRSIHDRCKAAGVPCFIKQLGKHPFDEHGEMAGQYIAGGIRDDGGAIRDPKGGNMAEWPEDLCVREWPAVATVEPSV